MGRTIEDLCFIYRQVQKIFLNSKSLREGLRFTQSALQWTMGFNHLEREADFLPRSAIGAKITWNYKRGENSFPLQLFLRRNVLLHHVSAHQGDKVLQKPVMQKRISLMMASYTWDETCCSNFLRHDKSCCDWWMLSQFLYYLHCYGTPILNILGTVLSLSLRPFWCPKGQMSRYSSFNMIQRIELRITLFNKFWVIEFFG
jgi:hypothetical protein